MYAVDKLIITRCAISSFYPGLVERGGQGKGRGGEKERELPKYEKAAARKKVAWM